MKLGDAIAHYVAWRQAQGTKFTTARNLLRQFMRQVGSETDCDKISRDQVLAFLVGQGPRTRHCDNKAYALAGFWRFAISRGFAKASPLPLSERRPPLLAPPHIYSRAQLRRLFDPRNIEIALVGTKQLDLNTFRTLLLLLYGAGLRFSEATGLLRDDCDLKASVLTIRDTKFYKSRLVPVGMPLATVLARHQAQPAGQRSAPDGAGYLLSNRDGTRLASSTVQTAFDRLRRAADVRGWASGRSAPRMHDLRHSFAVHRLTAWYREGADVQRLLPVLSTYLGHSDLEGTKIYLTMTPELLHQASMRFARFVHGGVHA
jgi:site-specific recombinase XerD